MKKVGPKPFTLIPKDSRTIPHHGKEGSGPGRRAIPEPRKWLERKRDRKESRTEKGRGEGRGRATAQLANPKGRHCTAGNCRGKGEEGTTGDP